MPGLVPKGPDVPVDLPKKSPLSNAWDPHRIRHSLPKLLRTAVLLDRAEPQGPQRRVRVRRRSGLPARCERPGGLRWAGGGRWPRSPRFRGWSPRWRARPDLPSAGRLGGRDGRHRRRPAAHRAVA